jgi:hypothetical protein
MKIFIFCSVRTNRIRTKAGAPKERAGGKLDPFVVPYLSNRAAMMSSTWEDWIAETKKAFQKGLEFTEKEFRKGLEFTEKEYFERGWNSPKKNLERGWNSPKKHFERGWNSPEKSTSEGAGIHPTLLRYSCCYLAKRPQQSLTPLTPLANIVLNKPFLPMKQLQNTILSSKYINRIDL